MSTKVSIKNINGISSITTLLNEKPLKILTPKTHTNTSHIVSSNYGGGMVQGDEVSLEIKCGENTQTLFSTQANSRVYKSDDNRVCTLSQDTNIENNSLLIQLNDPLVLQKGSSLNQNTIFNLSKTARLIYCDWVSSGRVHIGEKFEFDTFFSNTEIYIDNVPVVIDRFKINTQEGNCTSPAEFGHHTSYINLFIIGDKDDCGIKALEQAILAEIKNINALKKTQKPNLLISGDRIKADVFILRASAEELNDLKHLIHKLGTTISMGNLIGFNPFDRKY